MIQAANQKIQLKRLYYY